LPLTRERFVILSEQSQTLGVDLITEFTPGMSPRCCLKQRSSMCQTICPNLGIFSSLFACAGCILS